MTTIKVILGSTRPDRFGEKPARWVAERLGARGDLDVELVDLRDYPLPFYEAAVPPARAGRAYDDPATRRWGQKIDEADGFVVVTPEYNHGYPAALKNAFDHTFPEWQRKPVSFVGYGGVGAARAIEQLRQVAVEMEMAPLRHAVHVLPDLMLPAMRAPAYDPELFAPLEPRLTLLGDDLAWWATALATARAATAAAPVG
jgi:NAD(P)H-dependent FMN reductase